MYKFIYTIAIAVTLSFSSTNASDITTLVDTFEKQNRVKITHTNHGIVFTADLSANDDLTSFPCSLNLSESDENIFGFQGLQLDPVVANQILAGLNEALDTDVLLDQLLSNTFATLLTQESYTIVSSSQAVKAILPEGVDLSTTTLAQIFEAI